MDLGLTLIGIALIGIAALDIFGVVLATRAMGGLVTPFANSLIWAGGRWLDQHLHLGGRLMILVGPALLVFVVALWAGLFITGFACLYRPMLGEQIQASSGGLEADMGTALYFSGFNFATLGIGDIIPVSDLARMLTVVQACTGFAVFTLGISYTLNIFQAVNQRDIFALSLHGGSDQTGRAEVALLGLCPDGKAAADAGSVLEDIADNTYALLQMHHAYPIAHFFRRRKIELAMSRIAFQVLDLVTLAEALLERETYASLLGARGFLNAKNAALRLVHTTREMMWHPASARQHETDWQGHFDTAYAALAAKGLTLRPREAAWSDYRQLRQAWNPDTRALAEKLGYNWAKISGDVEKT